MKLKKRNVFPNYVRALDVQKHDELNLKSATTEINFIVKHIHFPRGRLKLRCTATIYNIYRQDAEKIIEEDRPRLLASGPDSDFISNDDGEHDYYLNHLANSSASIYHRNTILYIILLISHKYILNVIKIAQRRS
uniref:Uncharacterized protein n=1 Tax=Megaselia scalaris TaxID=36166 RepID=T1GVN4_MEGSC